MVTHQGSSPMIDRPMKRHPGQGLVGDRVGELAEPGDDVVLAGQVAVEAVGQDGQGEDARGQHPPPGSSGWASSIQANTGTSTMRNAVSAFGTFQGLASGSGAAGRPDGSPRATADARSTRVARGSLATAPTTASATRSTPSLPDDDGVDQVADPTRGPAVSRRTVPSTSGPWCAARPIDRRLRPPPPASAPLPDPRLGALADQLLGQVGDPRAPALDLGRSGAGPSSRLACGAVLVGVAEHADRVQLGPRPGTRQHGSGRPPSRRGSRRSRCCGCRPAARLPGSGRSGAGRSPGHRTGASGAARPGRRAGRTGRSRAPPCRSPRHRLDQARAASPPAAGRRPGSSPARPPRPARSAASPAAGGRRGPCRSEEEFSLTRNTSRTPCSASQRASATTSAGGRET